MKRIDTLISARWIIPIEPANTVLENHSIAVDNGRIVAVLPTEKAHTRYTAEHHHEMTEHCLMPGLINAHTHLAMSLLRGLADDLPLMEWLNDHIWPAEKRWMNADFVTTGSELAVAESLRGGVTCVNDMYFFAEETADVIDRSGMRACLGMLVLDFASPWSCDADEAFHKGIQLHDKYRHHPRISTAYAPHAPYTVSDANLQRVANQAEELDIPIHIHVHETAGEISQGIADHGVRPLQRLDNLGLLSPRLLAVHMTQLNDDDIVACKRMGVHIVHCPESNLKLASGFCPITALDKKGINIALGTDGAASNNDLDMFGEMRQAALLAKAVSGDASAMPAHKILRMATLNGAKALGLDTDIGSLKRGKTADITAIKLDDLESQPLYDVASHLVYATGRHQVSDVWVAGKQLLKNRRLLTLDKPDIIRRSQAWAAKIKDADTAK